MTDENRKDQDKQEELTEKDLDKASGGAPNRAAGFHDAGIHENKGKHEK